MKYIFFNFIFLDNFGNIDIFRIVSKNELLLIVLKSFIFHNPHSMISLTRTAPVLGVLPPSPSCLATLSLLKHSKAFSFLFLDLEHSPQFALSDLPMTLTHLQDSLAFPTLVRIPAKNSLCNVQHALDSGARNLLYPMINNREEAERVVDASLFPPLGTRGCASSFWNSFGTKGAPFDTEDANSSVLIGVQIETLEGLSNVLSIADTPGVDFVFLGPVDLASSLGVVNTPKGMKHPDVRAAISEATAKIRSETGKFVGSLCSTPSDIARSPDIDMHVCLSSQLLLNGVTDFSRKIKTS